MGVKKIVVLGMDQRHYYGEVDEAFLVPERAGMFKLRNVYQLCMIDQQVIDQPSGKAVGLSRSYMLMNVGSADRSLPELNIQPAGWYDLETCGLAKNLATLVEQIEKGLERKEPGDGPRIVPAGAGAIPPTSVPTLAQFFRDKK